MMQGCSVVGTAAVLLSLASVGCGSSKKTTDEYPYGYYTVKIPKNIAVLPPQSSAYGTAAPYGYYGTTETYNNGVPVGEGGTYYPAQPYGYYPYSYPYSEEQYRQMHNIGPNDTYPLYGGDYYHKK